jgi:hypothetical protein
MFSLSTWSRTRFPLFSRLILRACWSAISERLKKSTGTTYVLTVPFYVLSCGSLCFWDPLSLELSQTLSELLD